MPIRTLRSRLGRIALTPDEIAELRSLYDELPDACAAASEALGTSGALPTGMAMQRFHELDARVIELMDQIREILGG